MNITDTHSHLYEAEFDADREQAVARAREAGVVQLLLPAIDSASDERLFDMARRWPDFVRPMMGLHPTSVNDNPSWRDELARVERLLASPPEGVGPFCGVGEIGLDLYWSREWQREQEEAFAVQAELAIKYGLPVAVHTRDAWPEMCAAIERYRGRGLRGVFHAFSGDETVYRRLRSCGDFVFGVGGTVTYKNGPAPVVAQMDMDDIVLETDCPYLSPVPHRGRRNESAYIALVCERVAEIKGMDAAETARRTTAAAQRIFGNAPLCVPDGRSGAPACAAKE